MAGFGAVGAVDHLIEEKVIAIIAVDVPIFEFLHGSRLVDQSDFIVSWHPFIACVLIDEGDAFADPNDSIGALEGEVRAVIFVEKDVGVGVIDSEAGEDLGNRFHRKIGAPCGVRIGGERGEIIEEGDGVAVKTVVDELGVKGRGEKIVSCVEPARFNEDVPIPKGLLQIKFIEFDFLRAEYLLDGELVVDLPHGEARSRSPYRCAIKTKAGDASHLLKIEAQAKSERSGVGKAARMAARGVPNHIGHKGGGEEDSMLFKIGSGSVPVPSHGSEPFGFL